MYINRLIEEKVFQALMKENSKIIVIYGARQVGKTTFVEKILQRLNKKTLFIDADLVKNREALSSQDLDKLRSLVKGKEVIFIDEAQRINNIGINLKILHTHFKDLKIIVTGSSALDLANSIREPLTGRHDTYKLFPISFLELAEQYSSYELNEQLESSLIFGGYPDVLNIDDKEDKIKYLEYISSDYLYKDLLELENIKHSKKLHNLLKLLAFQVGSEVSYAEIANSLSLSRNTVENYIDLLEKAFVIKVVYGFSRNLRKEIAKKPKIYFYDLGVRNAIINNFLYLDSRNDKGSLWENFLYIERMKRNEYKNHFCSHYFWRTYTGAELDYVEEYGGKLYGYEFKWDKKSKAPQSWLETYDNAEYKFINKDNYLDFIT